MQHCYYIIMVIVDVHIEFLQYYKQTYSTEYMYYFMLMVIQHAEFCTTHICMHRCV